MGVLYEHWRPDLNECFYVGASWAAEDTRPHEMNDRNDDHKKVQKELSEKGLSPEVRIQAWDLSKDEVLELEILQIAYWKDFIGDRLTNITKGGEGICVDWTDDLRDRQRIRMIEFYQTPEGNDAIEKARKANTGRKQPEGWSARSLSWKIGNKSRTGMVSPNKGVPSSAESKRKMSVSAVKRSQTEEGQAHVRSAGTKGAFARWGTTEELAQAILDFPGTHEEAAATYGGTVSRAKNIRTRKTWRHLTPKTAKTEG